MRSRVKKKSIPDWHLYITQIETKLTEWYAMTSHVIAYRSTELLFGTHKFNFNCFFDDLNCVFPQIRCLSRLLRPFYTSFTVTCIFLAKIWLHSHPRISSPFIVFSSFVHTFIKFKSGSNLVNPK